jgi:nucleoside-diphosphate-sugar epimerase
MAFEKRVLAAGAGGFIGHHLVKRRKKGYCVRRVDIKPREYKASPADEWIDSEFKKGSCASFKCSSQSLD